MLPTCEANEEVEAAGITLLPACEVEVEVVALIWTRATDTLGFGI